MKSYDRPDRYACLHVIIGVLATLVSWVLLGIASWRIVDPETYYGGFAWLFAWIGADVIATLFIWTFIPYIYYEYFKPKDS